MPVHPVSVIASPALEVLGNEINELILVVAVIEDVWRDQPTPVANWADNHNHVARRQAR